MEAYRITYNATLSNGGVLNEYMNLLIERNPFIDQGIQRRCDPSNGRTAHQKANQVVLRTTSCPDLKSDSGIFSQTDESTNLIDECEVHGLLGDTGMVLGPRTHLGILRLPDFEANKDKHADAWCGLAHYALRVLTTFDFVMLPSHTRKIHTLHGVLVKRTLLPEEADSSDSEDELDGNGDLSYAIE